MPLVADAAVIRPLPELGDTDSLGDPALTVGSDTRRGGLTPAVGVVTRPADGGVFDPTGREDPTLDPAWGDVTPDRNEFPTQLGFFPSRGLVL